MHFFISWAMWHLDLDKDRAHLFSGKVVNKLRKEFLFWSMKMRRWFRARRGEGGGIIIEAAWLGLFQKVGTGVRCSYVPDLGSGGWGAKQGRPRPLKDADVSLETMSKVTTFLSILVPATAAPRDRLLEDGPEDGPSPGACRSLISIHGRWKVNRLLRDPKLLLRTLYVWGIAPSNNKTFNSRTIKPLGKEVETRKLDGNMYKENMSRREQ